MFIGILIGYIIGAITTLFIYACIIISGRADNEIYSKDKESEFHKE